jgi:hypothetical protein
MAGQAIKANGTKKDAANDAKTASGKPATIEGILQDKSHQAVSSYFIGPQAENLGDFKENIESILNELQKARNNYYPDDKASLKNIL